VVVKAKDIQIKSNLKNLYSTPTVMDGSASQDNLGLQILNNIIQK